jgi:hypothetical protein
VPHLKHCCDPQIFYRSRKDSIASHSLTLKAQGRHEATEIFESFPYDLLGYLIHHVHLSTTFLLDYSFDKSWLTKRRPLSQIWFRFHRWSSTNAVSMLLKTRSTKNTRIKYFCPSQTFNRNSCALTVRRLSKKSASASAFTIS